MMFQSPPVRAAAVAMAIVCGVSCWMFSGWTGVLYLFALPVVCAPGIPLGHTLFGRDHVAGWIAGFLLGYGLTTAAASAIVLAGLPSIPAFAAAWIAILALSAFLARRMPSPLVPLPPFHARAGAALLCVLLLVPGLVTRPFARLGAVDAEGNRYYRAYFIADFLWHTALTAELAKEEPRPTNPFLAPERLHYYWAYFLIPASVIAHTGMGVEPVLKVNAFVTALSLVATMFVAAWVALPGWPIVTATAVALTIVAPSIEGLVAIVDVVRRGLPLSELRDINVDAVAAWAFKGLRIDNLPRTWWYTPQHGLSCALGLLAIPVALAAGARARLPAIGLAGMMLGASLAFNPFLGAAFCAVYGLSVTIDVVTRRLPVMLLLRHAVAGLPVLLALLWCGVTEVGEGSLDALHIGFWGLARNATLVTFLLQFGPLLVLIAIGLAAKEPADGSRMRPALLGLAIAVVLMHFVALTVDVWWVGFRAGNLFFVFAPAVVARGLAWLWSQNSSRPLGAAVGLVLLAGLPTTVIDAFNAQDIANTHLSRDAERVRGTPVTFDPLREFHWTFVLSKRHAEALEWIRMHTPATAVVQAEPTVRGRETWSLIPSFAGRRMATGLPVPLLARPIYAERNARVREIYQSPEAQAAWVDARDLRIDYIYVDQTERRAYPHVAKFDAARDRFAKVFENADVAVYAVRR